MTRKKTYLIYSVSVGWNLHPQIQQWGTQYCDPSIIFASVKSDFSAWNLLIYARASCCTKRRGVMSPYTVPVNKKLKHMGKHKSQHRNFGRGIWTWKEWQVLKRWRRNSSYYCGIVAASFLLAVITLIYCDIILPNFRYLWHAPERLNLHFSYSQ